MHPCDTPGCTRDDRCGYCDGGIQTEVVSPEVNFSNQNAMELLSLVGERPGVICGGWEPYQLPGVRRAIIEARALKRTRSPFVREESDTQSPGKCRMLDFGNTDDQILDRLDKLESIVVLAHDRNATVDWG